MPIKPLEIEEVESKAGNIYEAIVISAKRSRQLNEEEKLEFNQRVEPIVQQEVEDESIISKEKQEVSIDFESRTKQTERSLAELLNDQLEFRLREEEDEKSE